MSDDDLEYYPLPEGYGAEPTARIRVGPQALGEIASTDYQPDAFEAAAARTQARYPNVPRAILPESATEGLLPGLTEAGRGFAAAPGNVGRMAESAMGALANPANYATRPWATGDDMQAPPYVAPGQGSRAAQLGAAILARPAARAAYLASQPHEAWNQQGAFAPGADPTEAADLAAEAATSLVGQGMRFARPGGLGMAGSRLKQPAIGELAAVPAPGSQAWRDLANPKAPFPQYATEYPPIGPPQMKPKDKPSFPGEMYPEKLLTPEAAAFAKARLKIGADMRKGFEPYFDPEQRGLVDYTKYPPPNADTSTIRPKTAKSIERYGVIDAPETRARLEAAVANGEQLGNAHDWYFMSQLEKEYSKELGPEAGRTAFLDQFAAPLAATTSGQAPTPNLMTAHYLEYMRARGEPAPTASHELPTPVGGRFAAHNLADYARMRERGGYAGLGIDQPKMHDFTRSMIGDLRNPVIDEQMAGGLLAGQPGPLIGSARDTAYGQLQDPVRALAAERGVLPGAIQDVAWAGFKDEPGKPMIQIVNEAIERTHRLTGMARSEIVRRALVRKELPLYGMGAAVMGGLAAQDQGGVAPQ